VQLLFHIFRHDRDGRLEFVGSTQTLQASRQLIRWKASEPTERFAIYNASTHEITHLHAAEAVDATDPTASGNGEFPNE
jgi:hypothetical protein